MDFSQLDERGASEHAKRLHLRLPATGEEITHEGAPCVVLVKGIFARTVQAGVVEEARARISDAAGADEPERLRVLADSQKLLVESAAKVVDGFENVIIDGRPATKDDALRIMDLNFLSVRATGDRVPGVWQGDSFAQQVLRFSNELSNFFGTGLMAPSGGPVNSATSTPRRKAPAKRAAKR